MGITSISGGTAGTTTVLRIARPVNTTRRIIPARSRQAGIALICCYIAWALIIPIKNVVMIKNPSLRVDSMITNQTKYAFDKQVHTSTESVVAGNDVEPLLRRVITIVMNSRALRDQFENHGAFEIDLVHQLLSPEDFRDLAKYYALLFQAIEFPGGVLTPRRRVFASKGSDVSNGAIGLWILPTNGSDPWLLTVSCADENAIMDGTRCFQNNASFVCYDFPVKNEQRTFESVSLEASRINSGLSNSIGLLNIVEAFHVVMANLFSTKSWNKTLEAVSFLSDQASTELALNSGFSSVFRDGIPTIREKFATNTYSLRLDTHTTTTLESCFHSEIIASLFYSHAYVLDLILSTLIGLGTQSYGVDSDTTLAIPRDRVKAVVAPLFGFNITLTSGARPPQKISKGGTTVFNGFHLTTVTQAEMRFKTDTRLMSTDSFGSSLRMLRLMAQYPEYYSSYTKSVVVDVVTSRPYDFMRFALLGGAMSGLNTFKRDWWGNTAGVFKLAEIPHEHDAPRIDVWWDEEAKYAAWFEALENSSDAPFLRFDDLVDIEATGVALDDNPVTRCHRAFYKTLVKLIWLSLLTSSAQPTYLNFMGNINGGARPWFVSAIKRNQLVGELSNGQRYSFMYSGSANKRKNDGGSWVVVPLLQAMLEYFGRDRTLTMIMTEYNTSFPLFVTTEYGLMHFPDSAQCKVGFQRLNVSAETNSIDKIAARFFPVVKLFITRMVDDHSALTAKMTAELAADGVEMVKIPKEMLVGSPSAPNTIGFVGSPVFWRPTPLSVGLLKFWPANAPPPNVIELYRNATVCYRTLELRYLNESMRCWVEPGSWTQTRIAYDSEWLRYIIWSNWSISWVLNSIAVFIALRFFRRFVNVYKVTQFRCISFWVAAQYNIQSVGVLTYAQVVLMTISAVPLLVAFHLPNDPEFMFETDSTMYPKAIREILVTLSASWFVRIGFDSVNQLMELHDVHTRVNAFHLRAAALMFILIVRLATPDELTNADYAVWKLFTTMMASIALGVLCALVPFYLNRQARKVTPEHTLQKSKSSSSLLQSKNRSIVVQKLKDEGLPLNRHGLLGFSRHYGWAVSGLIMEGWEVYERKHRNQIVLTRGACRIELEVDDRGRVQCLL